ncbi:MAG: glycosyltransferase [Desulfuromonadales bacterium]
MRYSVVVPVYNEEANVEPLYGEVSKVLGDGQDWELIFIDDGSQDKTYQRLKTLASRDERVQVVLRTSLAWLRSWKRVSMSFPAGAVIARTPSSAGKSLLFWPTG